MLDELAITNLGIIGDARLEPGPGLVVVTGETGAGKTMLLGALRLLIGEASSRELVGPAGEEAVVDGRFVFAAEEVTVRRRVEREGRSRAYVDGSMAPARALQERVATWVEIVGQHDHLILTTPQGARGLLDGTLDESGRTALEAYHRRWAELVETRRDVARLGGGRRELARELEMVGFQAEEIAAAGFSAGDDAELTMRVNRLRNSETLAEGLGGVAAELGDEGAAGSLTAAATRLRRLARVDESLEPLADQVEDLVSAVSELQVAVAGANDELEHDPAALAELEERLHLLGMLRRKYGETLDEVLGFGVAAAARAAEIAALLERAEDLETALSERVAAAELAAATLREARRAAADGLAAGAVGHLRDLGMEDPLVELVLSNVEPGPSGADRVELRFASDASLAPGPAAKIASGGELSRLVLALRLAAGVGGSAVVAFDEVDAGIGGATALAMGEKLKMLSVGRQIFCVTHLPQVAAQADCHYVVERRGARATVSRVVGDDRLAELSRMLGGLAESERGRLHAAELIAAAGTE
jgi:DNA repair protein RecN (Recombination protein N)